jgi:hypothetical protein
MPVWFTVPPTVARPCFAAATSTSSHVAPPPAVIVGYGREVGLIVTVRRGERSITRPEEVEEEWEVEWAPPRMTRGVEWVWAKFRTVETEAGESTRMTACFGLS